MHSSHDQVWNIAIHKVLTKFLANFDDYTIEESEVLLSIFEGGQY